MRSPFTVRPFDYYLLWVLVIISLGANIYLVNVLRTARRQIGIAAGNAALGVGQLRSSSIDYPVEIRETLPVSMTINYQDEIAVPISVTLPIDQEITVPLQTPLGTFPINVPLSMTVPINLSPVVPINLSVPVSTTVPVNVVFPIQLQIDDTALGDSLAAVELYLRDVAVDLGNDQLPAVGATVAPE